MPLDSPRGTPVTIANTRDLGAIFTISNPSGTPTLTFDGQNWGAKGIKVVVDITAVAGGETVTVTIQGKDAASGKFYTLLASTALGAQATTVLTVFPAITASANVAANDVLPEFYRVSAAIGGGAGTMTATIGACLLS